MSHASIVLIVSSVVNFVTITVYAQEDRSGVVTVKATTPSMKMFHVTIGLFVITILFNAPTIAVNKSLANVFKVISPMIVP